MNNGQYEPHQKAMVESHWKKRLYGKRHFALQLITRQSRRQKLVRIVAACAAVMGLLASFYQ